VASPFVREGLLKSAEPLNLNGKPSHNTTHHCEVSMPNVAKPVAILASEAPVRTKPSNYPEPFASRMTGREKRPLGVSIRQSRLELGPLISQDRVHANNRAHHAQRIRDFQTFCSVHPPDVHRRIQSPIGSRMPTTRRFHRCIGQQSRNECQCLAPLAQGTPAQRSPSAYQAQ